MKRMPGTIVTDEAKDIILRFQTENKLDTLDETLDKFIIENNPYKEKHT